jgi:site-specific recombinase XerD
MQSQLLLDDLTQRVLQEIRRFGLHVATKRCYQKAYKQLKKFAAVKGMETFSEDLIRRYIEDVEARHKAGVICSSQRDLLRRAALLLQDVVTHGTLDWKPYIFKHPPYPDSPELRRVHAEFSDHLRSNRRSENTIQSANNAVRQFLLFLEAGGCRCLADATADRVPAFFQHLGSTYLPTSLRTVASNLRAFLRFAEPDGRLLAAVPERCARRQPIIPVLSEDEHEALRRVLQTPAVPLRDKAIILLALRTGVRAADIVSMTLTDIDWVGDTIYIRQSKSKTGLTLPLTVDVGNALAAYLLAERPNTDSPYVFLRLLAPYRPLGGHSTCYALSRRAFHLAGIRLGSERKGLHLLRHSAASRMLAKGVAVTTISSMLGHADTSSTDIYLSTDEGRLRACALDLAEIPLHCGGLR